MVQDRPASTGGELSPFTYSGSPVRVVFGSRAVDALPPEFDRLGASRVLILTTPGQAASGEALAAAMGPRVLGVHANATMHTPVAVTQAALEPVARLNIDCLVALGGGSTIGLAKAIARRTGLPQIAIPTTYAGSEMTAVVGETEAGVKTTLTDPVMRPKVAIYDVERTLGLPGEASAVSGLNAIAHAAEALYAREANPILSMMAVEGIRILARALPQIVAQPRQIGARSQALYGAWLCAMCLDAVGMALHHKLCHTLGGSFGLPHAETHAVILPHAMRYNADAAPAAMDKIALALGATDAPSGLFDLARRVGAASGLRDLGMPREGLDRAADLALANPYWNPRPIDGPGVRDLLERAWLGDPP